MLLKRLGMLVTIALVSCAGCSEKGNSAPTDAGADAFLDAAGDRRAPNDARVPDAASDAGPDWLQGTWDRVPCANPCDAWVARDPASALTPLSWKACTSGRAGCTELVVDWTPYKGNTVGLVREPAFLTDKGTPVLFMARHFPPANYQATDRFITVGHVMATGAPVFASALRFRDGQHAVVITAPDRSGVAMSVGEKVLATQRYRRSAWSDPTRFTDVDVPRSRFGTAFPGGIDKSGELILVETLDPTLWKLVGPGDTVTSIAASLNAPRMAPGGFLSAQFATGFPLVFVGADGIVSRVRTAAATKIVSGHGLDPTQGHEIAWVESSGSPPDYTASELYVSSFATSEAALGPRRVAALPDPAGYGGAFMVTAHGMALLGVTNTRVLLIRLSDGEGWAIDSDPGKWWSQPLWVDDDEVWIAVGTTGGNSATQDGIMRIRRDSLGPPTIPPS